MISRIPEVDLLNRIFRGDILDGYSVLIRGIQRKSRELGLNLTLTDGPGDKSLCFTCDSLLEVVQELDSFSSGRPINIRRAFRVRAPSQIYGIQAELVEPDQRTEIPEYEEI